MAKIVKRSARVILLDGDELVLIKRGRPGNAPYWVTAGGGVEESDRNVESALHREVFEELGATIMAPQLVLLITDTAESGIGVQHIFVARLKTMDLGVRTGTEFAKPERGSYEVVRIPFTAAAVRSIALMPPTLGEYIIANIDGLASVADEPREPRPSPTTPP
ncbi:NUDIX domain-containing protein [Streptomyces cinnamoneus]|uniref:NUDIX domain-containing protein n=1 Tax=Streptomyces cinnamoneus TaxID=53446 RepID=UPI0033C77EE1